MLLRQLWVALQAFAAGLTAGLCRDALEGEGLPTGEADARAVSPSFRPFGLAVAAAFCFGIRALGLGVIAAGV